MDELRPRYPTMRILLKREGFSTERIAQLARTVLGYGSSKAVATWRSGERKWPPKLFIPMHKFLFNHDVLITLAEVVALMAMNREEIIEAEKEAQEND